MRITYKKLSKRFPDKTLKNFFDESLPGKTLQQCRNIIKYSSVIIGAFDNNKLISISRALDDTVYSFVADVVVNLNYQRKGIGKKILKTLCNELIKKDVKIILCKTSKNLVPFYKSAANFKYNPKDVLVYIKNYKK